MKYSDRRYVARASHLAPWLWRLAYPVRKPHNVVAFRLWCALLKVHRAAWVRGLEL